MAIDNIKTVLHISPTIQYSRAEFFSTLSELADNDIHVFRFNNYNQEIWTENTHVRFVSYDTNVDGSRCDEIFGIRDRFIVRYLKDPTKPQFSGSLVEYIKKVEENAETDAFLKSELDKIREA